MRRLQLLLLCLALAAAARADTFHTLAPGIVLDDGRNQLYAMDRVGRLQAIDYGTGAVLWRRSDAAMPLGLVGGILVALDGRKGLGGARLLALDPRDGALVGERDIAMPTEVRARARPGMSDRFEIVAVPVSGGLSLRWHYQRLPMRGAPAVAGDEPPGSLIARAGVLGLSWDGATMAIVDGEVLPPDSPAFSVQALSGEGRIRHAEGLQILAADGDAVLASEAMSHPLHGVVFRWRILRRDGTSLGELISHYGSAPFAVRDGLLLYRRNPLLVVEADGGVVEQGSRLIGWDLASGRERWAIDVAEQRYFGPAPP